MHELPKDLTNSLRSFRRSISNPKQPGETKESADVEQGVEGYGEKEFDEALNTTDVICANVSSYASPSIIIH